jgi:hypothetical protein
MHLLKPSKSKGDFVTNLRTTISILTDTCRYVPKTAFKRPNSSNKFKRSLSKPQSTFGMEMEIESDEILLDEPLGISFDL